MFRQRIGPGLGVALCTCVVYAQDAQPVLLEMRVISVSAGRATVDRGVLDALELGDRVVFRLRDGGQRMGRVIAIEDRSSTVEPTDTSFVPLPGMRVEARLPADRFILVEEVVEEPADEAMPEPGVASDAPTQHPPWERPDDGWTSQMPLLAKVQPFRPEDRALDVFGRVYTSVFTSSNTEDNRSDFFSRVGASATAVNPFGNGGRLTVQGEWDYNNTDVPDGDGGGDSRLRIDRASYAWGGDRFASTRYEVGRFLHYEFPEFGVIDGVEWSHRMTGGNSVGASLGFLPDWDTLSDDGENQEISAWYRWVRDESEVLSFGAGYQKTFYEFDADRDLFVLKAAWLPQSAWTFQATTWIDAYGSGDEAKGSGVEITQAWVSTGRAWSNGSSIDITYRHLSFPETDRDEFLPVTQAQIADDYYDRVAIATRQRLGDVGLREEIGGWDDEDDQGGDGEMEFELYDALFDGTRIVAGGFGTKGSTVTLAGWRAAFGVDNDTTSWRLGYEYVQVNFREFSSGNDDLPEHYVSANYDWNTPSGWSISLHGDVLFYDEETGYLASVYVQRSF